MAREAAVREAFAVQAGHCERLGSPFTALVCRVLAQRLDRSTANGRRILDWPGDPSAGGKATSTRPLAWLRFEADPEFGGQGSLRLRLWPGGTDEVLALADHHVRAVEWRM